MIDPIDTVRVEGPEMAKDWKSRRIWQTPVVHLQTLALQAPSAKEEAAKYVQFWEIVEPHPTVNVQQTP